MIEMANDLQEATDTFIITRIRAQMTTEGKRFINMRKPTTVEELADCMIEWESTEGTLKTIYKRPDDSKRMQPYTMTRPGRNSFHCGKPGHFAKDCRSRPRQPSEEEQKTATPPIKSSKPVVCFSCREVGHKSVECPRKKMSKSSKKVSRVDHEHHPTQAERK